MNCEQPGTAKARGDADGVGTGSTLTDAVAAVDPRDARIAELEGKLAAALARTDLTRRGPNSGNFSLPPSSDLPSNKPTPKRRSPTGRKAGGQKGHKGAHRELLPPEQVDEVVEHRPASCGHQGFGGQEAVVGEPTRHQITELPPVVVQVTEHQGVTVRCDQCGQTTPGLLPGWVRQSAFGPRLQAPPSAGIG